MRTKEGTDESLNWEKEEGKKTHIQTSSLLTSTTIKLAELPICILMSCHSLELPKQTNSPPA